MGPVNGRVLVVDDEPDMVRCLADVLASDSLQITTSSSSKSALAICQQQQFGAVVSDIQMSEMNGLELMLELKRVQPELPVILVTGHATIPAAAEAVKQGAYHYVTKPCDCDELRRLVEEAVHSRRPALAFGSSPVTRRPPAVVRAAAENQLIGQSPAMLALQSRIDRVAMSVSPVLITGETGTGKELVARAIHARSARRSQPFISVNASAIPDALLESEMFGHVRGAFTGAIQAHRGYFAQASGGTLLLDEIGDMPLVLQAKLLRVLQVGEIHPVGSERPDYVDVRIIAATHRRLPDLVKAGQFREDLYYRLNVIAIGLPPLRKRPEDIPELARFFLARARTRAPIAHASSIRSDLQDLLKERAWTGNVRELESAIERLVVLSSEDELTPQHLGLIDSEEDEDGMNASDPLIHELSSANASSAADCTVDQLVRRHVTEILRRAGGDKPRAAKILGIDLSTLYRWQQKWRRA
jgi:two-component system, NtrC family, response regulator HydG